jgi:hypothetical protein
MPWVKLDDAIFTDEAVMASGPDGRLLFIAGLCHASRNLTDGAIDKRVLPSIAALVGADPAAADLLVELGLWVDEGLIYRAPRYLDFNPPAEKVRAERLAAKERMAAKRSGEVRANSDGSSGTPIPSPSRPHRSSSSSSSVTETGLPDDLWTTLASKKLAVAKDVHNPQSWRKRVIANDQADVELVTRATWLHQTYELTTSQLADCLISGGTPQWLTSCTKRSVA